MLDLFHIDPSDPRVQVFYARGVAQNGSPDYQMWIKPRGISVVSIFAVGSGAGGGNGLTGATGTARGGGSGGGSGAATRVLYPALILPDVLYVSVGLGGAPVTGGQTTHALVRPVLSVSNLVVHASGGVAGLNGTTTTNSGGGAGAASTLANASWLASGLFVSTIGVAGGAGGSGAGANAGTAVTAFNAQIITGGAGGGSTPTGNTDAVGGVVAAQGLLETNRAGGTTVGGAGQDGVFSLSPFWSTGGAGGGSNGAGTGGAGGNGGSGSGGGGGGGGIAGGAGGRGGDGLVIISCW